jgi:hypothetical protein
VVSGDCALCSVEVLKYPTYEFLYQIHPDARGRAGRCAWAT